MQFGLFKIFTILSAESKTSPILERVVLKDPFKRFDSWLGMIRSWISLASLAGGVQSGCVTRKETSPAGILCFFYRAQEKPSDILTDILKTDAWIICGLSNLDQYSGTDAAMASLGVSFIDTRLQHLKDTKWKINYNWASLSDLDRLHQRACEITALRSGYADVNWYRLNVCPR